MVTRTLHVPTRTVVGTDLFSRDSLDLSVYESQRGLLVADTTIGAEKVSALRALLERRGMPVVLYAELSPSAGSSAAEEAARIGASARVSYVVGAGGFMALTAARIAAELIAMGPKIDVDDLIDGHAVSGRSVPVIDIPFSVYYPFQFTRHWFAVDARNNAPVVSAARAPSDLAVYDVGFASETTEKQRTYDVLAAYLASVESFFARAASGFMQPVAGHALRILSRRVSEAEQAGPSLWTAEAAADVGVYAALGASESVPGPGTALALALQASTGLLYTVFAAVILPNLCDWLSSVMPDHAVAMEAARYPDSSAATAADETREIAAGADIPLRFTELEVGIREIERAAAAVESLGLYRSTMLAIGPADVRELLERCM